MRMMKLAAAALAVFTVAGCDINTGPQKPAQTGCNCAAPPAQAAVPPSAPDDIAPPQHRHRRHGGSWRYAYGGGHARSYAWRREYAELSVETYDYRSDSHSYVIDGHRGHGGGDRAYAYAEAGGGDGHAWVDGFGRHYGGEATAGDAAYHETGGHHGRLDPWHGYDVDCPDQDRRR